MTAKTLTSAAAFATLLAFSASAQPYETYGEAGDWRVLINQAMGNSCMAETVRDGVEFQIGVDRTIDRGFVALFTAEGATLTDGEIRPIEVEIDGDVFVGDAIGQEKGGMRGGYVYFDDPEFAYDLAKKYSMTLRAAGAEPRVIDLAGTNDAMELVRECLVNTPEGTAAKDPERRAELQAASAGALASLLASNDRAAELAPSAKAILVFPEITKFGVGIGGERGSGVLFIRDEATGFYRTTSVSVGAQLGVQKYSYAVMFLNDRALEKFQNRRGWELGVDGSLAIGEAALTAEIDTLKARFDTVAFVFDESGLMADLTVEGGKISELEI